MVYGAPINQQLEQLSQQLTSAQSNPALSKEVSESIAQVKLLLNQLQSSSSQAFQSPLSEEQTVTNASVESTSLLNTSPNQSADAELSANAESLTGTEQSKTAKALGTIGSQGPQSALLLMMIRKRIA